MIRLNSQITNQFINNKIHAIMKKVYLITMFSAETRKYVATYQGVFSTKELAAKQIEKFDNDKLIFTIIKVDMIIEEDYIC